MRASGSFTGTQSRSGITGIAPLTGLVRFTCSGTERIAPPREPPADFSAHQVKIVAQGKLPAVALKYVKPSADLMTGICPHVMA
jgi:hypothetical protein